MYLERRFAGGGMSELAALLFFVFVGCCGLASSSTLQHKAQASRQVMAGLVPPIVAVGTWGFSDMAVQKAAEILQAGGSALDAVEQGINVVEQDNRDQYYVGRGGYPNAEGVMELDAAIMAGKRRTYGAVAALQGCTRAVSVARAVMEHSPHNVIVGRGASQFAMAHGLAGEEALTEQMRQEWATWREEQASAAPQPPSNEDEKGPGQHDTIGLICRDASGEIVAGTSTSGWRYKHPGRVGDSPLVGSGLYADAEAGAAVATGDGEEIMRGCLSFLAVEKMREGRSPTEACRLAIQRVQEIVAASQGSDDGEAGPSQQRWHEKLTVAVVAMSKDGRVGAASTLGPHNVHRGRPAFPFVVWRAGDDRPHLVEEGEEGAAEHDPAPS